MADQNIDVIIRDHAGNEHVFPAGFDPTKAAEIVQQQNLSAGRTPLGEETASVPVDTFSRGFHEGLKKEPIAGGEVGFAEGLPSGLVKGAWDTILFPITAVKGLVGGAAGLLSDPVGTLTKARDAIKGLPAAAGKAWDDAIELASTDPEAWGKAVGDITGGVEGGVLASRIPLKPGIRLTGKALQAAGEHPFAARMSGGAMLGRGVLKGDVPTAAAGVATMALPKLLTTTGKALREFSGEDLSGVMPSGARTLDFPNASTKGIHLQPSRGVPARPHIQGIGEPAPAVTPDTRLPSGARTLDVDLGDLPVDPALPNGGRTAIPGSATGPAPYRASARAAQKAEDLATKAEELRKRTMTMETTGQRITESESGVDPVTGKRLTASRTFKPAGGEGEGAVAEPPPIDIGHGRTLRRSDNPEIYDNLAKRRTANTGGLREQGAPRPPVTALTDETGRPIGGAPGPRNPAQTGTEAPVAPKEAAVEDAAKRQGVRVDRTLATPPEPPAASVPFMITKRMEKSLRDAGHTPAEIAKMTPAEAHTAIREWEGAPRAGQIMNETVYKGVAPEERTTAIRVGEGDTAGLMPKRGMRDIDAKLPTLKTTQDRAEYLLKANTSTGVNYVTSRLKLFDPAAVKLAIKLAKDRGLLKFLSLVDEE